MAKILLIDDEPDIVYLVKKVLEKGGHQVEEAYTGTEGLLKAETENPALIVLDILMPDINGWDVARRLKSQDKTKNTPIVMLSVKNSRSSIEKSFKYAGADAHLGKPSKSTEILSTIERVLKESHQPLTTP
ncbi:alkaline phosphatase synthesis transcriptional regulatory protein PhoP [archaeon BMS3Abin16]|nr:alkaline phosphatase synthesis transcriptional regulatory protein PhoP [archaeon BMS3Abin16]HDY74667.1 response regulator [Euryarchaeota archaeon]